MQRTESNGCARRAVESRVVLALVVASLLVAACGTRRSHDEVVAAATGGAPAGDFGSAFDAGSPDDPTTGEAAAPSTTGVDDGSGADAATDGDDGETAGPMGPSTPTGGDVPSGGGDAPSDDGGSAGPICPDGPLSPVKVGHVGGYEGLVGATLNGGLEMAQVWARSVNARGGLNCHPVEMIAVNDRNDPNTNASVVRRLVEQDGVIAFVGNLTPLSMGGGLSYLEQKQVPIVGGDLVHPGWTRSNIAYPQGITTDVGAPGTVREGVKLARQRGLPNPENVAMFVCEVEACTSALTPTRAQSGNGYNLVYSPSISLAQTNFTNECREARSRNVGVLFVGGAGATLEAVANSCKDQGYTPQFVTYSLAIQDSLAGNPNLENVVGASPTFPWMLRDGVATEYARAIEQFAPGLTTSGAASQVWTSGKLLEAAAAALPSDPTSADVIAGLKALSGNDLGGIAAPLSFTGGKHNNAACYFVVQVIERNWTGPRGSECIS
jgi:branched-chain amino acid transport system substrate-binding protein